MAGDLRCMLGEVIKPRCHVTRSHALFQSKPAFAASRKCSLTHSGSATSLFMNSTAWSLSQAGLPKQVLE